MVGEVHVEMVLITIFADKNDLELFFISVDFSVLSSQGVLESTAAWSPVSTEVEANDFDSCGEGLSKRLHALISKKLGSNNILHFYKCVFGENKSIINQLN